MTGDVADLALLFAAGIAAGGVNAIAGGGTILTFAVLSAILPPGPSQLVTANVTSKIGLWPGAAAAAWACRDEWARIPRWARWLVLPSTAGAVVGVWLLHRLPAASFDIIVPWLILLAAVLFAVQPQVTRLAVLQRRAPAAVTPPGKFHAARFAAVWGLQLLVGVYGGYFGAGIGILMLATLAVLALGDIHAVNAVKNLLAAAVNGVATLLLVIAALTGSFEVSWLYVVITAIGSIIGGIAVARLSKRLPVTVVRRLVAMIAFALAGYYLWNEFA